MYQMFYFASAFDRDLGAWDVSQVTDMGFAFYSAEAFDQDLCPWGGKMKENTFPSVASIFSLSGCESRGTPLNRDVVRPLCKAECIDDVEAYYCGGEGAPCAINSTLGAYEAIDSWLCNRPSPRASVELAYGPLNNWTFGKISLDELFYTGRSGKLCSSQTYRNFNASIGGWDVSQVNSMRFMFNGASSFDQDIGLWNVSQVTSMSRMFNGAWSFATMEDRKRVDLVDLCRLLDWAEESVGVESATDLVQTSSVIPVCSSASRKRRKLALFLR